MWNPQYFRQRSSVGLGCACECVHVYLHVCGLLHTEGGGAARRCLCVEIRSQQKSSGRYLPARLADRQYPVVPRSQKTSLRGRKTQFCGSLCEGPDTRKRSSFGRRIFLRSHSLSTNPGRPRQPTACSVYRTNVGLGP